MSDTRLRFRFFWKRRKPPLDSYVTWKLGPSDDYKALLRGEISAEEYVRRLKRDVNHRLRGLNPADCQCGVCRREALGA